MVGTTHGFKNIKTPPSVERMLQKKYPGLFHVDFVKFCALVKACKISLSEL